MTFLVQKPLIADLSCVFFLFSFFHADRAYSQHSLAKRLINAGKYIPTSFVLEKTGCEIICGAPATLAVKG